MTNILTLPGTDSQSSALLAFDSIANESGLQPFPVTLVKDGNFKTHSLVPAEIKDLLPYGDKAIHAVFITYRLGGIAWQVGYDDRTEENKNPSYMFFIPGTDGATSRLLTEAAKSYQYTPKDKKNEYDFAKSGVGHIQPIIECLVYLPSLNNLAVIATGSNYSAVEETIAVIKSMCKRNEDGTLGEVPQVPILVSPKVAAKKTKTWNWDVDYIGMTHAPANETTLDCVNKFKGWAEKASEDTQTKTALDMWLTCGDRPCSPDIKAALQKAVGLVPRTRK
jgi:hypothetical protein